MINKKFLIQKYINEKFSQMKIGKMIKCSYRTVAYYLKKNNIPIRTKSESRLLNKNSNKTQFKRGFIPWNKGKTNYISKQLREKLSKLASLKIGELNPNFGNHKLKGKNNPMFGKQTHGKMGNYKNIRMRSSWEIKFAQWCDLSDIKWKYESKTFDLGYATYTPDFYLPEFDCYIEIKGYWRDDAKKKFKIFQRFYSKINIKIFDYKQLKNMCIVK